MCAIVPVAHAQAGWPARPIKVVVPFPAGGQLDVVVRMIGEKIAPALGQPILVETRLGADGNIGAEAVARSAPDGYTSLATSVPFATQVSLQPGKLKYDPVKDFRARREPRHGIVRAGRAEQRSGSRHLGPRRQGR